MVCRYMRDLQDQHKRPIYTATKDRKQFLRCNSDIMHQKSVDIISHSAIKYLLNIQVSL